MEGVLVTENKKCGSSLLPVIRVQCRSQPVCCQLLELSSTVVRYEDCTDFFSVPLHNKSWFFDLSLSLPVSSYILRPILYCTVLYCLCRDILFWFLDLGVCVLLSSPLLYSTLTNERNQNRSSISRRYWFIQNGKIKNQKHPPNKQQ